MVVKPQSVVVRPQSVVVKPQSVVVKPQSVVVKPRSVVAGIRQRIRCHEERLFYIDNFMPYDSNEVARPPYSDTRRDIVIFR